MELNDGLRNELTDALVSAKFLPRQIPRALDAILPVVARDRARQDQLVERLSFENAALRGNASRLHDKMLNGETATADLVAANEALAQVRALHTKEPGYSWCDHCGKKWPCETVRILDGEK